MTIARLRAWIYARRSRTQETQASVTDQKERGRDACEDNDWEMAGILEEEISASRYARKVREAWPELIAAIRGGLVDVVILWESSRGDRKLSEWATFLDECQERGILIHVISHDRTYNPANHRDWKTLASEGVDNDHFSRRLSVDVKRGKRGAMKRGRPSGQTPYGYRVHYNEKTGATAGWKIIGEHAELVLEIITSIGDHVPVRQLERDLNERSIPSPNGSKWTGKEIRHIARNCAYAGLVQLADGSYAERQPQADGAQWPPIVTRAQWEKAAAVLSSRATGPRPGGARHLLTGLSGCECGGALKIGHQGTYACSNHDMYVQEKGLDEWVRDVICERLSRDDFRDLYIVDDDGRSAILKTEITELEKRREKFRRMAADGKIDDDAFIEIEAEISPRIAAKKREAGAVRVVPALADIITADDTRAAWDGYTIQARREIVAAVTGVIVRRVGRTATRAQREDWAARVVFDWKPQAPKRKPGGRPAQ